MKRTLTGLLFLSLALASLWIFLSNYDAIKNGLGDFGTLALEGIGFALFVATGWLAHVHGYNHGNYDREE